MTRPENHCAGREEALAAFIDGRLPEAERAAMVEHLADCETCREIYAETVDLLEEEEAPGASDESPGGDVILPPRSRWRQSLRWTVPLAAAALLALAVASTFFGRSSGIPSSEALLAAFDREPGLASRLDENWTDPLWPVMRGGGDRVAERQASFRIGVRIVDLDLALRTAHDNTETGVLAANLAELQETALGGLTDRHRTIRDRLLKGVAGPTLVSEARQAEKELEDILGFGLDESFYRLGKWSEAARLAAMTGDRGFFQKRGNRRAFDRLRRHLGAEAPPQLAEIAALLDGHLPASDLRAIESSLEEVIRRSGIPPRTGPLQGASPS